MPARNGEVHRIFWDTGRLSSVTGLACWHCGHNSLYVASQKYAKPPMLHTLAGCYYRCTVLCVHAECDSTFSLLYTLGSTVLSCVKACSGRCTAQRLIVTLLCQCWISSFPSSHTTCCISSFFIARSSNLSALNHHLYLNLLHQRSTSVLFVNWPHQGRRYLQSPWTYGLLAYSV